MSVDLIIGGASKAGTTAIYDMLRRNPAFFLPNRKELHYFSRRFLERTTGGPGDASVVAEIPENLDDYLANYRNKREGQIAVDISPSYLFHHDSAVEIARELPDARMVFILRRPEDKVFSQYVHLLGEGRETLSFEAALAAEEQRKAEGYSDIWLYTESGYYSEAVEAFISALGRDRIKIVLFEDFRRDAARVLEEICLFAGLAGAQSFDTHIEANRSGAPRSVLLARLMAPNRFTNLLRKFLPTRVGQAARRALRTANTAAKPMMAVETRSILRARYAEDIKRLEDLIGRDTGWGRPNNDN